jgi:uncharacterized membrane protein (UPF0127 family)
MAVIKDLTQQKLLSNEAKIALSFFDRLFGLLNPRNPRFLIFFTHFGIHTLFMSSFIDILVLDQNQKVVKLKQSLAPFRLFFYPPRYSTVVEMPQGTIHRCGIRINDKIFIG